MNTTSIKNFKQQLQNKAHSLKPIIIIGNAGLTENVHLEIERALLVHELIKIRVNAKNRKSRQEMIDKICLTHQANLIQNIGHVIVIYRVSSET